MKWPFSQGNSPAGNSGGDVEKEFLILGPSNAGKTVLLATLSLASRHPDIIADNVRITFVDMNEPMSRLVDQAQLLISEGRLPITATLDLQEFKFTLIIRTKRLGSWTERRAKFTFWDGPGGSMFPQTKVDGNTDSVVSARFRMSLVQALKKADGFILCVDSSDKKMARTMFEAFPSILMATGLSQLPCRRVCVCLTKADLRAHDDGMSVLQTLESSDPISHSLPLISKMAMGVLSNYCTTAEFGFGWTSVYGFLDDGAPNYDPTKDKLRQWSVEERDSAEVVDSWRPYGVIDPFIWIAGGDKRSLELVRGDQLL